MPAAREEGIIEIVLSDAGEEINTTVKKYNTAVDFPTSAETTPSERPWLEYGIGRAVNEDEYVKLYFIPAQTDNIVADVSKVNIPITTQNLTTGSISSGVLTAKDFDLWAAAGSTGIPCTAGERRYLGKYKVPAKQVLKLGNYTARDSLDKLNGKILIVPYDDTQ
jgi:hypothetical protein